MQSFCKVRSDGMMKISLFIYHAQVDNCSVEKLSPQRAQREADKKLWTQTMSWSHVDNHKKNCLSPANRMLVRLRRQSGSKLCR